MGKLKVKSSEKSRFCLTKGFQNQQKAASQVCFLDLPFKNHFDCCSCLLVLSVFGLQLLLRRFIIE